VINIKQILQLARQISLSSLRVFGIVALIVFIMEVAPTSSFLFDDETSSDNKVSTGTLAIDMRSGQSNFISNPLGLEPGDSVARDVYAQKLGSADMNYKSQFEILPGSDSELCNALEVRAWHNWYDSLPSFPGDHSSRHMDLKYSGYLPNLEVINDFDSLDPYFNNVFYGQNEHWFYYSVSLPTDASPLLQNKVCNFNIITTSWQVGGAEGFGFHDTTTLGSVIATGTWSPENLVVINEFIPDPIGDDNASKPGGEWVELYNNGDSDFDLAGWALYDAYDTHELTITTSNSDNNGNPLDGGETIIPAHGYLVVYRNGDNDFALNNTGGDSVRLYNDVIASGILIDSHVYTGTIPESKSFARSPDGVGAFVDPVPTPGRSNVIDQADLDPSIKAWRKDANYLNMAILDGLNYENAQINVIYDRDEAGEQTQDGFSKTATIDRNNLYLEDLYFGTESSGSLYPHYDINNIEIEVILSGSGIPDRTLNLNL
jgi:hypothetical protein